MRILGIDPARVLKELSQGKIVIVAGFQGIADSMDVTTLGRGGSDTTAVAVSAKLGAKVCERYTDVDGIYTADPQKYPSAKKFDKLTYLEALNLRLEVMDATALSLCLENKLPIIVFDFQAEGSIELAVTGESIGTIVSE